MQWDSEEQEEEAAVEVEGQRSLLFRWVEPGTIVT